MPSPSLADVSQDIEVSGPPSECQPSDHQPTLLQQRLNGAGFKTGRPSLKPRSRRSMDDASEPMRPRWRPSRRTLDDVSDLRNATEHDQPIIARTAFVPGPFESSPEVRPPSSEVEGMVLDDKLEKITLAIAKAKLALDEVQKPIADRGMHSDAPVVFKIAIEKAQSALDNLDATAALLKDGTGKVPYEILAASIAAASVALQQITSLAAKYGQYSGEGPWQRFEAALAEITHLSADIAATKSVNHGTASSVASSIADSGASFIRSCAGSLDARFQIKSQARVIDERYAVKVNVVSLAGKGLDRVHSDLKGLERLDSQLTGGMVAPGLFSAFEKGMARATDSLSEVQTKYESAKRQQTGGTQS